MKQEKVPVIRPRGMSIITGSTIDFNNMEEVEQLMLDNNQAAIIVRTYNSKITSALETLIINEINWLTDDDADNEWAIFAGDKDINTVLVPTDTDLDSVIQTLVLASSIFLVVDDSELYPLNVKVIQQGLKDYESQVKKVGQETFLEREEIIQDEEQEINNYEDDLFTTVSKRKYEFPSKCFNVFIVDAKRKLIRKSN